MAAFGPKGQVLLADPAGRVGGKVGPEDGGAAGLTGSVLTLAQALQCPVDVVQDSSRLSQFGFVPLFHGRRVPRPVWRSVV